MDLRYDNNLKVDMHIHSTASDGTKSPKELVKMYKDNDFDVIALTDHDGTDGVKEALEEGKRLGIKVVPGIEIGSVINNKSELHILGYDIDIDNRELQHELESMKLYREERNLKLLKLFQDMGYDIGFEDLKQSPNQVYIGKPKFARAFIKKGYVKTVSEAFSSKNFIGNPEANRLKQKKVVSEDAIKWIVNAGGYAVLAHPMKTHGIGEKGSEEFYAGLEQILIQLKAAGLSGLECYHPSANEEQSQRLHELANKYDLKVSKGSDYHGLD